MSDVAGQLTFADSELEQLRTLVRDLADGLSFEFPELRARAQELVIRHQAVDAVPGLPSAPAPGTASKPTATAQE